MTRPILIGLTGSIGMGKSTTAKMFAELGIPIWDADQAVHRLYESGGIAVEAMSKLRPQSIIDGAVDRTELKRWISNDPSALRQIETIVHPLVAEDRANFIDGTEAEMVVLDIPLLFETGGEKFVDVVVVVSAPSDVQRKRVLARPEMTSDHFQQILAKQTPDKEKRARADFVIETTSLDEARKQVQRIIETIRLRSG